MESGIAKKSIPMLDNNIKYFLKTGIPLAVYLDQNG